MISLYQWVFHCLLYLDSNWIEELIPGKVLKIHLHRDLQDSYIEPEEGKITIQMKATVDLPDIGTKVFENYTSKFSFILQKKSSWFSV